jgi:hypothetical protein
MHETLAWVEEVTVGNAAAAADKVKEAQTQVQKTPANARQASSQFQRPS